ncbi:Calcineurin-like phosphoesterase [Paenibacillus sp. 1_12]|uniref:metallophosphoesterase family protein n=1 Tax=Paenibacillus sp. 1_12 TaxID=1566278 RepID=UPI0008E2198A|nr:metallophosphoesterase [Paenibacillus sp. 1_12]SFL37577.1 Calcineurin-like phosphoesterase [Paenibacillus sp. 1_12]
MKPRRIWVTDLRFVWLLAGLILLAGCSFGSPTSNNQTPHHENSGVTARPADGVNSGTNPETTTKPFRFVVMGDSRGSSNGINEVTLRSLLDKIKGLKPMPEFLMFTGDQVVGGSDVGKQLGAWTRLVDDYFPMTSVYPALGNHEHDEKIFTEAFPMLPKEQLPGYQKTVYAFDYGNARFITLNSDRKNAADHYVIDEQQRTWLENQLKTSGSKHIFVQFHVPAYPIGAHLGSSLDAEPADRDALWSLLDKYKVTAVLVGHEHNYNRRKVDASFDGSGYHFVNSIYQLTIGGAGAPLYNGGKETKQVVVGPKASYHYMIVDVDGSKATFKVYDLQQNEIDSFIVER